MRALRFVTHWTRNLSVAYKMCLLVAIVLIGVTCMTCLYVFGMYALSVTQFYIRAEGLWAKAQKDATYSLRRYVLTHDEEDYRTFQEFLKVPLGHEKARIELERPNPDWNVAYQGLIEGGNSPEDVEQAATAFRRFRELEPTDKAIRVWTEADGLIAELEAVGAQLHELLSHNGSVAGEAHQERTAEEELLDRIDVLNEKLTECETEFSATLNEGSRQAKSLLLTIMLMGAFITVTAALSLAVVIGRDLVVRTNALGARTVELTAANHKLTEEVTKRKLSEKEREKLVVNLEAKNAELEQFSYTVSHDLKSPLITIKGYVGVLREDLAQEITEQVEDSLGRISSAADKMHSLLDDLLELSRVGRVANPPEDFSLEELANEAMELVAGRIKEKGVRVRVSSDLPTLHGDHSRLRQVLQNLIENSVKYMGDQHDPSIEIGARQDGKDTVCFVRDNGVGIEPEYHEKVFGLFERLDSGLEGTGVGLAIVKRIVEFHNGRVWVESEGAGKGATFCFTIAAKKEAADFLDG